MILGRRPAGAAALMDRLIIACVILALTLFFLGGHHAGFLTVNAWLGVLPDRFWALTTHTGDTLVVLAIIGLLALRYPGLVGKVLIAALIGSLFTHAIKRGFPLERPPAVFEGTQFQNIGPDHRRGSFPSGHTVTAFTFAAIMLCHVRHRTTQSLLLAWAVMVGLSRIAVGVHFPIDVLSGAAGGMLSGWLGVVLGERWRWSQSASGERWLTLLPLIAALQLLGHDGGYDDVMGLATLLGVLALLACLLQFTVLPSCRRKLQPFPPHPVHGPWTMP